LVAELVTRLGGQIVDEAGDTAPISSIPESERAGRLIKGLRLRAGMTQKTLADAIGLPQSHISEFEKNRRAVPYKHAQKLAEVLRSIPSRFMTPNAETIAAMNGAGEDGRQIYAAPETMYKDLGL
jgi:transcriptional regulator with XRE-family HTH domain